MQEYSRPGLSNFQVAKGFTPHGPHQQGLHTMQATQKQATDLLSCLLCRHRFFAALCMQVNILVLPSAP